MPDERLRRRSTALARGRAPSASVPLAWAAPPLTAALCALLAQPAAAAPCAGFNDVDSSASYCEAVDFVKHRGVTSGCTAASYCPGDFVTRAQMALFMQRLARGGPQNVLGAPNDAIGGGDENITGGEYATVAGGHMNKATGYYSIAAGGSFNVAQGQSSFAAGSGAIAWMPGSFVWSDLIGDTFNPSVVAHHWTDATNTFNVRATGGVWFVTGSFDGDPTTGVYLNSGSGTWSSTSDRASKENFRRIDAEEVLARVTAMPIDSWNYIAEGAKVRHIGPVAQDFHAAFDVGPDDRSITTIDEGGVALAAIKGLNDKLERENAALRARLDALERAVAR